MRAHLKRLPGYRLAFLLEIYSRYISDGIKQSNKLRVARHLNKYNTLSASTLTGKQCRLLGLYTGRQVVLAAGLYTGRQAVLAARPLY